MSDTPFGFGPADRDPDKDRGNRDEDRPGKGGGHGPEDPFGFGDLPGMPPGGIPGFPGMPPGGAGGFDVSQLGQMLTQLGQMLSHAGSSGGGPVNYELAGQLATQQLAQTTSSLTPDQRKAVADAVQLAELWLNPATEFPVGATETQAWTAIDWVKASMPTWKRLCDPVAQRVAGAWVEALPEPARAAAGPMLAMLGQMGGLAFGSQLGSGLSQLAAEVLTSTDIGVPVGPERTAALLPEAIEKFTAGLDRPASEVMIFLATREAAHQRLFAHVGWLRERLLGSVEEYARGITVDTSRIEELAGQIDPANPASIQEAMQSGMFEPQTTPAQKAALARLETLLALIEGWVDAVVADAVRERLPGAEALRETLRRRRASGGPAEQAFATIVGLELRPRKLRAAAELWRLLGEQRGIVGRDSLWAHPDLVPTAEDLDDPAGFVNRVDDIDPIAEIERQVRADEAMDAAKKAGEERRAAQSEQAENPESDQPKRSGDDPDRPDA
ncbi:zinc-dependent metalloprotease [Pseudonocardia asaccharolytica]|uniref:Hydrolase n=1 Tax=Pseudonocardia asaccharolytica DSM 44247 = NBRC 16224 TaxID=1123024 RepID=A0A511D1H9_9PSEU|nr:zinc-dependent metalloprotease [Pseudonocardia asaccharolytica]GEL18652.1 hydrolase [Pseudonocardia asaccharolytica DSM 44247 = NBRC 16224]